MSFRCSLLSIALGFASIAEGRELRVCADPNNLPFSNDRKEGFENRLADLIATSLNAHVTYVWWAQRKSFVKNTLNAGRCDVILGIPSGFPDVLTTEQYYKSAYVLVSRKADALHISSLGDPRLTRLRIGMHVVGNDFAPPGFALARRGVISNVVAFSLFGPYGEPNPPGRIIEALEKRDIDIAVAWGPLAGYYASKSGELDVVPITQDPLMPTVPLSYSISLAVRKDDPGLKSELDRVLEQHRPEIRKILDEYGVPQL